MHEAFAACALTWLGVAALRGAWHLGRRHADAHRQRRALRWGGWSLLIVATGGWMQAAGPDRGVAIAALAVSLAGLLWLLEAARTDAHTTRRPPVRRPPAGRARAVAAPAVVRSLWVAILAGPVAMTAALLLGMLLYALALAAGMGAANGLAVGLIAAPLLWCLLLPLATAGVALRTRSAILLGVAAIGATAHPVLPLWTS
ncbi:MAG: hypothetical protein ABF271_13430 [Abyssibacter sp.]|uniref:hypothetical protein n=1 Tax=Abyssibacter sp. TaxID=2320200 RepID=UPI00321A990B